MSHKRQLIAVDCDDVIANINDSMREFVNLTYGTAHTSDDYRVTGAYHRYWERVWGMPEHENTDRFAQFVASGRMAHLEPVPGALQALQRLGQNYDLALVTARSDKEVGMTEQWLDTYAPDTFSHVTFMHLWDEPTEKATKAKICQQIGAEYLIDDNYEHCRIASSFGLQTLLFGDYGWNRAEVVTANMTRTLDWQAVEEYFHGTSK